MEKKSLGVQCDIRTDSVAELILQGKTRHFIIEYTRRTYNIGRASADVLIAKASKQIQEINLVSAEKTLAQLTHALWKVYDRALAANDFAPSVSALREIAKLKGLDQITINHRIERELIDITEADLEAVLEGNDE